MIAKAAEYKCRCANGAASTRAFRRGTPGQRPPRKCQRPRAGRLLSTGPSDGVLYVTVPNAHCGQLVTHFVGAASLQWAQSNAHSVRADFKIVRTSKALNHKFWQSDL